MKVDFDTFLYEYSCYQSRPVRRMVSMVVADDDSSFFGIW